MALVKYNSQFLKANNSFLVIQNLFDFIKSPLIRNAERNNVFGAVGTEWTVTAIDNTYKWIQVDNDLPIELQDASSGDIQKVWCIYATDSPEYNTNVSSIDWPNKKIYYTITDNVANITVGKKLVFFNPFKSFSMLSYSTIISKVGISWGSVTLLPGPCWKHSDGTYRLIFSGSDGSASRMGLASSSDLITWTLLNSGNYYYQANTAPFNKTWTKQNLVPSGNAVKVPNTNYFAINVNSNDLTSNQDGVVIIDENFNIINVPDNPVAIPGVPIPNGGHNQPGGVAYFNGQWYLSICSRHSVMFDSEIYTVLMDNIYTSTTLGKETIQIKGILKTWMQLTLEWTNLLVFKNKLYCFLSGEADLVSDVGSICAGNREFGIYTRNSDGTWTMNVGSPYLVNPVANDAIYLSLFAYDLSWARDHVGGWFSFIEEGDYLYWFGAFRGTEYLAASMKLKIK